MLKKRLIFILLTDGINFFLSRNFTLQKIGDLRWLLGRYNFSDVSKHIDEIVLLNVARQSSNNHIHNVVELTGKLCELTGLPMAVGGGIRSLHECRSLFAAGADRLAFNGSFFGREEFVTEVADIYGSQAILRCIDIRITKQGYTVYYNKGTENSGITLERELVNSERYPIGEILIRSIERDGTGQGLDIELSKYFSIRRASHPIILCGGVGTAFHMTDALSLSGVDAVGTANILNFIGDGFRDARVYIEGRGVSLPNIHH